MRPLLPVADRVAAGMIAANLVPGLSAAGEAPLQTRQAMGIALPLVFYSVVLAITDRKSWFTWLVPAGLLVLFVGAAAVHTLGASGSGV